mgnify:FL=1
MKQLSWPLLNTSCFAAMLIVCYMSILFVYLSNIELETVEFTMGTLMDAVMSQGMIRSREKGLQVHREMPADMKNTSVFGDQLRLQQVLADFLTTAVRFTASSDGWVGIKVNPTLKNMGDDVLRVVHFEFRYEINKRIK